jgi:hypothetical protein
MQAGPRRNRPSGLDEDEVRSLEEPQGGFVLLLGALRKNLIPYERVGFPGGHELDRNVLVLAVS